MKFLKRFFLFEALDLKTAREVTRIFIESGGKQRLQNIFKGKDRIYYDFTPDVEKKRESELKKKIKKELEDKGFSILSYLEGTAKKVGDDKNTFKIQRLLTRWGLDDLKSQMDRDPERSLSKHSSKKIVISRHGIDIGGASTGRSWTSCMSIYGNVNGTYIASMIEAGSLVAYLIDPADLNINKPLARIKINPFISRKDPSKFLMYPDIATYGNFKDDSFMKFVENWCMELNKTLNPDEGDYFLDKRCHTDGRTQVTLGDVNLADVSNLPKPGMNYHRTHLSNDYSFENFYDIILQNDSSKAVTEDDIKSMLNIIRGKNLLKLVISYINKEDNQKTADIFSKKMRLMNGFLKLLKEDIFEINEEKSRIIVTKIFNEIPPDVQELIISNNQMILAKNKDFIDWIRENIFKFNLVDPKFVSAE